MSGSLGTDRQPVAITYKRQLTSSPRSVRMRQADVVVPRGLLDAGAEHDVAAQVVLVGDVVQVAQDLRLGGVLLRPCPLVPQSGSKLYV